MLTGDICSQRLNSKAVPHQKHLGGEKKGGKEKMRLERGMQN